MYPVTPEKAMERIISLSVIKVLLHETFKWEVQSIFAEERKGDRHLF